MTTTPTKCRCGFDTTSPDPHPCHGTGYSCRKPAIARLQVLGPAHVAGVMTKFAAHQTWACDDCWSAFDHTPTSAAQSFGDHLTKFTH